MTFLSRHQVATERRRYSRRDADSEERVKKENVMKKFIATVVPLGLALFASTSDARTFTFPQTGCQPVLGSVGCIEYSQYGAHNVCGGTATVECPLAMSYSGSPTVNSSSYFAYDRSTVADVSCTLQRTDFSGAVLFTTTVNTTGGGVGSGIQLRPLVVSQNVTGYWWLRCSLPGVQTAGWFSHISNIFVSTTE